METVSRQVRRADFRQWFKEQTAKRKRADRQNAKRDLLERQSRREKSGFYEGRIPVGVIIMETASRKSNKVIRKGVAFGRHLRTVSLGGKTWALHATKGWRLA